MSSQITEPYPLDCEDPREICTTFWFSIEPFAGQWNPVPGSTSSPQTFEQIRSWLKYCANGHKRCGHRLETSLLPNLLIDLEAFEDRNTLKIIDTSSIQANNTPYIAISHDQHGQLSQSYKDLWGSLKSGGTSIAFELLPPVFRHSIRVTQELGIRYLWIDLLCLREDHRQAPKSIDSIFENSFCTVAAAATPDAEKGLFRSIPTDGLSVEFECKSSTGEKKRIRAMRSQKGWMLKYNEGSLSTNIQALRERELSPRVIHFAESEVLWECRSLKAFESWPGENMPKGWPHSEPRILDLLPGLEDHDVFDFWHQATSQFAERSTQGDDGTLEIAASVAQKFQSKTQSRYIAGMWEKDLRRSLAWAHKSSAWTYGNKRIHKRYPKYLAPSWSWASVHGQTWYQSLQDRNNTPSLEPNFTPAEGAITITNLSVVLSSPEDEFSSTVSAELHINTPIIHGVLGYDASSNSFGQMIAVNNAKGDQNYGDLFFDVPSERQEMGLKVVSIIYLGIEKSCTSYTAGHRDGGHKGLGCCGLGLAIVPVKGKTGFYQRVGIVQGIPAKNFIGKECVDIVLI